MFQQWSYKATCSIFSSKTINPLKLQSLSNPNPNFHTLFHLLSSQTQHQHTSDSPSPQLISQLSRVLSDHRKPHHDLDLSLHPYSSKITTNLVEAVLKRCKNLGFPAHRFFLWAKKIPGFEHSTQSYYILIDILGSSKQFAILWDFMMELNESDVFEINPEVFWIVFRNYCKSNLPDDAIRAFSRMAEFGINPSVDDLDKLFLTLCKRKYVKHAHEFFDRIKDRITPTAKTYSILIRGWGDIGESNQARKLFDEMLQRGFLLDLLAYNSFLDALCKGGNIDEAYKIFQELGTQGMEPDAYSYSIFVRAYCEANDMHSAFRVLDRMKRCNLVPNVFTYNGIIKKLCTNDKVDEAYLLLDEMVEKGINPDTWSYNSILAYHCDHSEVNMALRLISRMEKQNCMPDRHTYNMVLKLLIRVGRFDRATEVWEGMGDRGFIPSVSTYSVMVHGFCNKHDKVEEACRYFEVMIDEGIPPYDETVRLLRNRLIGFGLSDTVGILADKMEQSSSCTIQELADAMRGGKKGNLRSRKDEIALESE